jgi:hypothetical protein
MGYRVRLLPTAGALLLAAIAPASAGASQLIGRNASHVRLAVSPSGVAHLAYRSHGRQRHVLVWGAVNAVRPNPTRPQVEFKVDYSGGGARGGIRPWQSFRFGCAPYDGPALAWLVTACRARDGSYWAVQRWSRLVPRGRTMTSPGVDRELRISHWTGGIAHLAMNVDWAYGRYDHVYGRLTYRGFPVYAFGATRTGVPRDGYGRNIYLDTLDSALGVGWRRENSFLSHNPTGVFCYTLFPRSPGPPGSGKAYRATVMGPGVTPDVVWTGRAPGPYDHARELEANAEQRALFSGDRRCRPR